MTENTVPADGVIANNRSLEARMIEHPSMGAAGPYTAIVHRHCNGAAMRAGLHAVKAIYRHVGALTEFPVVCHVAKIPTIVMTTNQASEIGSFHHRATTKCPPFFLQFSCHPVIFPTPLGGKDTTCTARIHEN